MGDNRPAMHERHPEGVRHAVASHARWAAGTAAILLAHAVWLIWNRVPPAWDMAYHQLMGWRIAQQIAAGNLAVLLQGASDYYPPLYHFWEAVLYLLTGAVSWIAGPANLPGLLLLSYCTYRLTARVIPEDAAVPAGHLVLLFPLVAWTSRESLVDPSLAGVTAVTLLWFLRLLENPSRCRAIAFGLVTAAGCWLKWTFPLFLVGPAAAALYLTKDRRGLCLRLLDAALVAAPVIGLWYLPRLADLQIRFAETAGAAAWEGDPAWYTPAGILYYPRVLSGYYLFLPLTLLAVGALVLQRRRNTAGLTSSGYVVLLAALVGGWMLLTLLPAKDPRYVMPLAVPLAAWLVVLLFPRPRLRAVFMVTAVMQFLSASFMPPLKVGLFGYADPCHYRNTAREWVWFSTHYSCVLGAPRREDWGYDRLIDTLADGGPVGFVPEHPRFHVGALQLAGEQAGGSISAFRLGIDDAWPQALARARWVVGKSGDQGVDVLTRYNQEVYDALEVLEWPVADEWKLPDGSRATVWRNPSRAPSPFPVAGAAPDDSVER